jgi:hypothetical protein
MYEILLAKGLNIEASVREKKAEKTQRIQLLTAEFILDSSEDFFLDIREESLECSRVDKLGWKERRSVHINLPKFGTGICAGLFVPCA